ncbi:MAG TPA: response regulator transcription factor [Anaerolineales bacterium]
MARILVVDDEPLITESLTYSLQLEGFEVESVGDGSQVFEVVEKFQPDIVVLDIMLPGMSGLEVCRRLRTQSAIPVIMLTARSEEIDRVMGLEGGADDYLVKPFSFRELLARIRAILRRVELDHQTLQDKSITIGELTLDPLSRRAYKDSQEVELSAREFDLLAALMRHAGQALSREDLHDEVWGKEWVGDPRTLAVHIRWLRLKVEDDPASPNYIQTVRGYGYRFAGPEELSKAP